MAGKRIFAVVQVDGPQAVQAHGPVKGVQHAVQIIYQIIPAVVYVAGIQAHAQQLRVIHPMDHGLQLFKGAANLAALARHGLKEYSGGLTGHKDRVQRLRDQSDAGVRTLIHVATGVEVIKTAGEVLQPGEIVRHRVSGKLPKAGVGRAAVQGIWRMSQNGEQTVFSGKGAVGGNIRLVQRLRCTAAGIAGEKLKGVGADFHGCFPHE
ncbi:hypothetical protein SDC9_131717 [bioreactor metagenome]|uniref:Uncharacterized protein n=1 Tax=bioreactor metagenome TaxID=1076179 RepID=A0A645D5Q1_9ZZZZ